MKRVFISILAALLMAPVMLFGGEPFRGTFVEKNLGLKLVIDLYSESVDVPGMEMFGPLNGYINGTGIYRTWYVSKIRRCDENKAIVHFSNDLGSETQPVELTLNGDSLIHFSEIEGSVMKKSVGKKLVKMQSDFVMKRE